MRLDRLVPERLATLREDWPDALRMGVIVARVWHVPR